MLMMDTMEAQAMLSLQSSLRAVGSLLALFNQPSLTGQYGLCAAVRTGKGVSLQACMLCLLEKQPLYSCIFLCLTDAVAASAV